jgi:hypothetical protein
MLQVKSGSFIYNLQLRIILCRDYEIVNCTQDGQTSRPVSWPRISLNLESAVLGWCIIIVSRASGFHLLRASDFRFCAHPLQMARTTPWKVLKLKKQFQGRLKTPNLLQLLETSSKIIRGIALQRTTWYTCDFFSCHSNPVPLSAPKKIPRAT